VKNQPPSENLTSGRRVSEYLCLYHCRNCGYCTVFRTEYRGKRDFTSLLGTNQPQACWAKTPGGWILQCPCSIYLSK